MSVEKCKVVGVLFTEKAQTLPTSQFNTNMSMFQCFQAKTPMFDDDVDVWIPAYDRTPVPLKLLSTSRRHCGL